MYLGGAGMKAQMKYADRRGSPVVVIQGGDERAEGEVQIKDLIEGARMSAEITDNAEWRAARPGAGDGGGERAGRRGAGRFWRRRRRSGRVAERSRSVAPPSVLPAISPTRGEIGRRRPLSQSPAPLAIGAGSRDCRSPPLWGRCPAGQRGAP